MESIDQSAWFVARPDGHDGPISESAMKALIRSGNVNAETLIWTKGMPGWLNYGEYLEIENQKQLNAKKISDQVSDNIEASNITIDNRASIIEPADLVDGMATSRSLTQNGQFPTIRRIKSELASGKISKETYLLGGALLCTIGIILCGILILGIPAGPNVTPGLFSPMDTSALAKAASPKSLSSRIKAAIIGPGKIDDKAYIAKSIYGNVFAIGLQPSVNSVIVQVVGVPGTILHRMRFSVEATLHPVNGIVYTDDLGSVPQGFYDVRALDSTSRATLAASRFFLGGINDQHYQSELREHNARLKAQEQSEREEIEQYANTMKKIMAESTTSYANVQATSTPQKWRSRFVDNQKLLAQIQTQLESQKADQRILSTEWQLAEKAMAKLRSLLGAQDRAVNSGAESQLDRDQIQASSKQADQAFLDLDSQIYRQKDHSQ